VMGGWFGNSRGRSRMENVKEIIWEGIAKE
jgi:hypothetical protein